MGLASLGIACLLVLFLLILPVRVSVAFAQDPLAVTVATYSGAVSTYQDYLAVSASVTSGGIPVSNALVTFSDSFNEQFHGSVAATNSSGIALTEMQYSNGNSGTDTITASVTVSGQSASGKATVDVLTYGNTQLYVSATIENNGANGGSSAVIAGVVSDYGNAVPQAKVKVSDTIGSIFPSQTTFSGASGGYSLNFTFGKPTTSVTDLVTVAVSAPGYSGSNTTKEVAVYPYASNSLTVNLDAFYPSTYSTYEDYAVVQALVTAGGTPVSGVQVTFSDSFGETFQGSTATTNADGRATTVVHYANGNNGLDIFTAQASAAGFTPGIGSNALPVLAYGSAQLYITEALSATAPSPGASDTVSGQVNYYGAVVGRAAVTISDAMNSFAPITVYTNASGLYEASFPVPNIGTGCIDIILASTADPGYTGSASAVFLSSTSGQVACGPSSGSTKTVTVTTTSTFYGQTAANFTTTQVVTQTVNGTATTTQTIIQGAATLTTTVVQSTTLVYTATLPGGTTTLTSLVSQSQGDSLSATSALLIASGMVIFSVAIAVLLLIRR